MNTNCSVLTEEVLSYVDELNQVTLESMLDVYDSISHEYEKMVLNNCSYIEGFVQEGKILDEATGKGNKGETTLYKIFAFIPRLITALLNAINDSLGGDDASNKDSAKKMDEKLKKGSPDDVKSLNQKLKQKTGGIVSVEPKRRCLVVRGLTHIKNYISIIVGCRGIIKDIKDVLDNKGKKKNIVNIATELNNQVKGIKATSPAELKKILSESPGAETSSIGLGNVLLTGKHGLVATAGIMSELSLALEKKAHSEWSQGMDYKETQAAKQIADDLAKLTGIGGLITTIASVVFGFSAKKDAKNRKKNLTDAEKAMTNGTNRQWER